MSALLRGIVEAYVPEPRWNVFFEADEALQRIRHVDHHVLIEALVARYEQMSTEDFLQEVEAVLCNSLIDCISEYGIGIKDRQLRYVSKLLQAMFDLVDFEDKESLLVICENGATPEETLAELVAFIYGDVDFEDLIEVIDYVRPSLIERLQSHLERRPDPVLIDEDYPDPAHESAVAFLRQYQPPRLMALLDEGFRLGFKPHLYLQRVIDVETMSKDELALEYMAACVAAGEDRMKAVQLIERRLGHLFDDLLDLQEVIQKARKYLE